MSSIQRKPPTSNKRSIETEPSDNLPKLGQWYWVTRQDASNVLHYHQAPDFEAYRYKCNASLKAGSITVGQEDAWQRREAEKECRRRDRDWRDHSEYRPKKFEPYGDPGPGYVAKEVANLSLSYRELASYNRSPEVLE